MLQRGFWAGLLSVVAVAGNALGGDIFVWTDGSGVVHFADQAPQGVANVERRSIGGPPPPVAPAEATPEAQKPPEPPPPKRQVIEYTGPAQVILASHKAEQDGKSTQHLTGKVQNVGGESARRVTILVRVVDADQGSPCVDEEFRVKPENIEPGQTATFDEYVNTPCFLGNAGIDITPAWD